MAKCNCAYYGCRLYRQVGKVQVVEPLGPRTEPPLVLIDLEAPGAAVVGMVGVVGVVGVGSVASVVSVVNMAVKQVGSWLCWLSYQLQIQVVVNHW